MRRIYYKFIIVLMSVATFSFCSRGQLSLVHLTVEYSSTPLGMDVQIPHFAWQMQHTGDKRGFYQTAYQIVVADPSGDIVWNSGKVETGKALAIAYGGSPLKKECRYKWTLSVWDQDSHLHVANSWFETGLIDPEPDSPAWNGARWIGGGDEDLVFFSPYQLIFRLKYSLSIAEGSIKAGFVYGANDMRLRNKYKNIRQLEKGDNESYIKLELDISKVDGSASGLAALNIYRVGYTRDDDAGIPVASFDIKPSLIHSGNKHDKHTFEARSAFGRLAIIMDGDPDFFLRSESYRPAIIPFEPEAVEGASVNLNPFGLGGDYLPYGMVCDIGFSVDAGQQARFSGLEILNDRAPHNTLFREDLSGDYQGVFAGHVAVGDGCYNLDGGMKGTFIVADPSRNSTPMLRTEFESENKLQDARLYVTSRGIYEFHINGHKVGEDCYNPGLTQYNRTHMYQTYDVTELVREGRNAMGAMMAEGWWSGLLSFVPIWNHFGDRQSLLAKLVLRYGDGSEQVITTNEADWKYYNNGPVIYSSLNLGEVYDATKEAAIEGWSEPGYDDSAWKPAVVVPLDGTTFGGTERAFDGSLLPFHFRDMQLVGQIGNNAGVFKTLQARSVKEVRDGIFVYDMGQNFVGVPRITIKNGMAGDTMTLRVSEMLYPHLEESGENVGMVMTENYRAALCKDIYIMKDGPQVFQPRFTSRGYQYIEVSGMKEALPLESVQGVAISSVLDLSADYTTSNEKVNQLWSNLVWSNIDNFLSIPTDCPQRNERMGWSGDISVFSRTATYVSPTAPFLRRHMLAMRDLQQPSGRFTDVAPVGGGFGGVLWGSAGMTVPWEVYQQYQDVRLLEEHYDAMVAYMEYLETTIDPETGFSMDGILGDWLGPQNNQLGTAYLTTAYHVYDLWIMKNVADLLGKEEDASRFSAIYESRKEYFNTTFVNASGKTMAWVGGPWEFFSPPDARPEFKEADTQTSYAVGLALGAFSDENKGLMAQNLAETVRRMNMDDEGMLRPECSLMTGFIGTAWISKALSENGYSEEAYRLLQNDSYPSWLYAIDQGATTIWERLNGYTVENGFGGNNRMNSFNHYSFGAVGQWMMAHSLGIQRDEPGFRKFILRPEPDPSGEMTWAEGWYESMYGRIYSRWDQTGDRLVYEARVPANTTATLYLPALSPESIQESGVPATESEGITLLTYEDGEPVFTLQSGSYRFELNRNEID